MKHCHLEEDRLTESQQQTLPLYSKNGNVTLFIVAQALYIIDRGYVNEAGWNLVKMT